MSTAAIRNANTSDNNNNNDDNDNNNNNNNNNNNTPHPHCLQEERLAAQPKYIEPELHEACRAQDYGEVRKLINAGRNVNGQVRHPTSMRSTTRNTCLYVRVEWLV